MEPMGILKHDCNMNIDVQGMKWSKMDAGERLRCLTGFSEASLS